jgi:hypothetical protein
MTDRGILFSAPMVRALLDGRKCQTRRVLNPQPVTFQTDDGECEVKAVHIAGEAVPRIATGRVITLQKIRFAVGDRLWVKETWQEVAEGYLTIYRSDYPACVPAHFENVPALEQLDTPWRPSILMPRKKSRLTLTVTDVTVQRVQDISEEDAIAEGLELRVWDVEDRDDAEMIEGWSSDRFHAFKHGVGETAREAYSILWDSLHDKPGERWDNNPWIVAVSFDVRIGDIDREAA